MFFLQRMEAQLRPFLYRSRLPGFQVWIHLSEASGAFERGARVEAVAEVDEQGLGKQAIGARESEGS